MKYPSVKTNKVSKNRPQPGEYVGTIDKIEDAPGYNPGDGIVIFYTLEKNGKKYPFKETFPTSLEHERTNAFIEYVAEIGATIDDLSPLIGAKERIVLKKFDMGFGVFTNIAERDFIREAGDENAVV